MRVSVVLPARNEQRYLGQAVGSILHQTERAIELIVVDDGSTDGTAAIVEAAAARDSRVRLLRQRPAGIAEALNRGIGEAHGVYVARMDADDIAQPDRLRRQADYLDARPDIGLVGSRVEYLGDRAGNQGLALFVEWSNSLVTREEIEQSRFVESPLVHPSVMFRREVATRHGVYRDGDFPEDYELWLRWAERGVHMAKIADVLLSWRDRPGRLTRSDPRYSVEAFHRVKAPYLVRWLERHNPHHPSVVVWGAGRTSRHRLRYITDLGIRVEAFVDIDPRKVGHRIGDADVIPPDSLPTPGDCFVLSAVGSRGARADIETELRNRGFVRGRHCLACA